MTRATAGMADAAAAPRARRSARGALLFGLFVFGLLWFLNRPFRQIYQPTDNDVTALTDGLLLLPGAQWQDWFVQGHSRFFDTYPEWPLNLTAFARPGLQFTIYLAHFLFGRDWASYLAINYAAVAGIGAVAFAIARTTLGLDRITAAVTAGLVVLSPAVLEFSIWQVGFASESLASVFVGCAFLALVARRDLVCLVCLCAALLTKETALWAPLTAAFAVLLRPVHDDDLLRRGFRALAMLLPLALWLGLRLAFFGGIGGTYVTADYTPVTDFLSLFGWKVAHLHHLFLQQGVIVADGFWASVDRLVRFGTAVLMGLLLILWAWRQLSAGFHSLDEIRRKRRWPTVDASLLVSLWGAVSLAFYLALALPSTRYAASSPMFVWPVVVGEVVKRRNVALRFGLVACFALSLTRTSPLLQEWNAPSAQSDLGRFLRAAATMNAALRQVPTDVREIYVLTGGWLVTATPDYFRAFLDVPQQIVRVVDIRSFCEEEEPIVRVHHVTVDGAVTLDAQLPACATFFFNLAGPGSTALVDGRLRRSDRITYELPEAHPTIHKGPFEPALDLGHRITVHVRPPGPARFIFEPGEPGGGLAWFDTP
jgi:hypothetical protein